MLKNLFCFFLLLFYFTSFSQSKIKAIKAGEGGIIMDANVYCNDKFLGKTNDKGLLEFHTKCKKIRVKALGYYDEVAIVDDVMEVVLSKTDDKLKSIEMVVLEDKSDQKAIAILDKVDDNYKNNSPKSLKSYAFKSYEKLSLDFDEDSIAQYNKFVNERIATLENLERDKKIGVSGKDSIEKYKSMKVLSNSKFFLWERAQEFLFSKKQGEKINVLDNRISGFQQPIYEMMALRSNRNQIPREIKKENRGLYRYFLTDTIEIDGRRNYVIRFREVNYKQPIQRKKFNGYLYIDMDSYGLKKIESNSKIKNEGSITSIWKLVEGKWFLSNEDFKVKMGNLSLDDIKNTKKQKEETKKQKFKAYGYMTSDYFDFQTPIDDTPEKFKGYTFSVQNTGGNLLNKYRTDSLTTRELNTYKTIDSIGKEYNIDKRVNTLLGLIRGKVRIFTVDIDLGKIVDFDLYEGWRLGLGVKLNEKFNKYFSPDGYFAYGFKSKEWKYGFGADFRTTLAKNSFFRAEYYDDVSAAGLFNKNQWSFRMKVLNMGIDINNDHYYSYHGFKISYENDLSNSLTMNISAKRNSEIARFDYLFLGQNQFINFNTLLTLKYSPKSKNIMTPLGKFTIEQGFPELYFNYEQGIKAFGGDLSYGKFDALYTSTFKTKAGVTGYRIYAGFLTGKAPIWNNFIMNGMASTRHDLNFNFTTYLGFATMEGGQFYNDKFVGYYFTHEIPWYFKSFGKNVSSLDVVYKGIIGDMKNPEYHQFEFQKMDHLYQEIGLEYKNFLSSYFNLGLFYRVGFYSTPKFFDNFAVQFKLNLLKF